MIKCKNACPTGQFEGCCFECDLKENCEEACQLNPSECGDSIMQDAEEETGLQVLLGPKENITFFHYTSISGGCKWKLESLNLN